MEVSRRDVRLTGCSPGGTARFEVGADFTTAPFRSEFKVRVGATSGAPGPYSPDADPVGRRPARCKERDQR